MSLLNKTWLHQYSDYEEKTPISSKFKHHQRIWHPRLCSECGLKGYEENYTAIGKKPAWIRLSLQATGANPLSCTASKGGPTDLLLLNLSTAVLKDSWTCQTQGTATCLWSCEPNPPKIPARVRSHRSCRENVAGLCSDCSHCSPKDRIFAHELELSSRSCSLSSSTCCAYTGTNHVPHCGNVPATEPWAAPSIPGISALGKLSKAAHSKVENSVLWNKPSAKHTH